MPSQSWRSIQQITSKHPLPCVWHTTLHSGFHISGVDHCDRTFWVSYIWCWPLRSDILGFIYLVLTIAIGHSEFHISGVDQCDRTFWVSYNWCWPVRSDILGWPVVEVTFLLRQCCILWFKCCGVPLYIIKSCLSQTSRVSRFFGVNVVGRKGRCSLNILSLSWSYVTVTMYI